MQEYGILDRTWIETWPDIYLKEITDCKPATPIEIISIGSTITIHWCPNDCIDYFGIKWTEKKIRGQKEYKMRLCRFAFYMYDSHTFEKKSFPFCFSKPFLLSYE